jgi:hypothetical protein
MLSAFVAASRGARGVGTAPVLCSTLIALVSVLVGQIARLVYEPSYSEEVAKYWRWRAVCSAESKIALPCPSVLRPEEC